MNRLRAQAERVRRGVRTVVRERRLPTSVGTWLTGLGDRLRPEYLHTYAVALSGVPRTAEERGYRLVEATAENLDETKAQYMEFSRRKHAILKDRLASGDEKCWLIVDADGEVTGYCHMAFTTQVNDRINHTVEVGPTQVYLYDDHVFKGHRRRGYHSFSIARRLELARDMGRTEALTTISDGNVASIASYTRLGFRPRRRLVAFPGLHRTLSLPARRSGSPAG